MEAAQRSNSLASRYARIIDHNGGNDGAEATSESHPLVRNNIHLLLECLHRVQQTGTDSHRHEK
jgi:hypothetical protein